MVAHGVEKKAHHDSSRAHDKAEIEARKGETTPSSAWGRDESSS